jgi:hypothetical protein
LFDASGLSNSGLNFAQTKAITAGCSRFFGVGFSSVRASDVKHRICIIWILRSKFGFDPAYANHLTGIVGFFILEALF